MPLPILVFGEDAQTIFPGLKPCNLSENDIAIAELMTKIKTLIGQVWVMDCVVFKVGISTHVRYLSHSEVQ